jgi:hypothetical protein
MTTRNVYEIRRLTMKHYTCSQSKGNCSMIAIAIRQTIDFALARTTSLVSKSMTGVLKKLVCVSHHGSTDATVILTK